MDRMLERRPDRTGSSFDRAIAQAGGWFVSSERNPDVDKLVRSVRGLGVKAFEPWGPDDLSILAQLPELEFLNLSGMARPDLTPVSGLKGLRGLQVDAFTGALDPASLASLEWLSVGEPSAKQLEAWLRNGHHRLHHFAVGRYRSVDLAPLSSMPALTHLSISNSQKLAGLCGGPPHIRAMDLGRCPGLLSLHGIASMLDLEALSIEKCKGIEDLTPLQDLPGLRLLALEQGSTPNVSSLAGHPGLQHLMVIGTGRMPFDHLLAELPRLRSLQLGRRRWARINAEVVELAPIDFDLFQDERLALLDL